MKSLKNNSRDARSCVSFDKTHITMDKTYLFPNSMDCF